jgi:regulator of replication initiation timing
MRNVIEYQPPTKAMLNTWIGEIKDILEELASLKAENNLLKTENKRWRIAFEHTAYALAQYIEMNGFAGDEATENIFETLQALRDALLKERE